MRNKKFDTLFSLILIIVTMLIINPIGYLDKNYFEVKKIDVPEYIKEIQKIKSSDVNYYIGHVEIKGNPSKSIKAVKDSIMEYIKIKNITDYKLEMNDESLRLSIPELSANQLGKNDEVEVFQYDRLGTLRNTIRLDPETHRIIFTNIDGKYDEDNWHILENKEVVLYVAFNDDTPEEIYNLIYKLEKADLGKILLKFRFLLIEVLLLILLVNFIMYINAKIKLQAEVNLQNKMFKERKKFLINRDEIIQKQRAILNDITTEIYKDKEKVENIISRNFLHDVDIKMDFVPEFIVKELNINEKYLFYKQSLESLEKYQNNINNKDELDIKKLLENLYKMLTGNETRYFAFSAFQEMLIRKNINIPNAIERLSKEIDLLNSKIGQAVKEYKEQVRILSLGFEGEERVQRELQMYDDHIKVINNTRVQSDDIAAEIDSLAISTNGIYLIEVKNLGDSGRYSLKVSNDGRWTKILWNREEVMSNITGQQNRQIAVIQKIINTTMRKKYGEDTAYIYVNPIIAIANDNVDINNMSDVPILRISNIYRHIMNNRNLKLSKDDIQCILDAIEEHRVPLKAYPVNDYLTPIKMKYNKLIEIQKGLLSLCRAIVEFGDYYQAKFYERLDKANQLEGQIKYDDVDILFETFNNINMPAKEKIDIQYLGLKGEA